MLVVSRLAGFGRHVLGDRAFGVQGSFAAGVDALSGFFDVGAGCFQADHIGDDQFVGVALLFRQRRAGLNALGGIRNGAIQRGPSGSQTERRDHHARVTEDQLRLHRPWPSTPPTSRSASTYTSLRASAEVLLRRMPCLSSGLS